MKYIRLFILPVLIVFIINLALPVVSFSETRDNRAKQETLAGSNSKVEKMNFAERVIKQIKDTLFGWVKRLAEVPARIVKFASLKEKDIKLIEDVRNPAQTGVQESSERIENLLPEVLKAPADTVQRIAQQPEKRIAMAVEQPPQPTPAVSPEASLPPPASLPVVIARQAVSPPAPLITARKDVFNLSNLSKEESAKTSDLPVEISSAPKRVESAVSAPIAIPSSPTISEPVTSVGRASVVAAQEAKVEPRAIQAAAQEPTSVIRVPMPVAPIPKTDIPRTDTSQTIPVLQTRPVVAEVQRGDSRTGERVTETRAGGVEETRSLNVEPPREEEVECVNEFDKKIEGGVNNMHVDDRFILVRADSGDVINVSAIEICTGESIRCETEGVRCLETLRTPAKNMAEACRKCIDQIEPAGMTREPKFINKAGNRLVFESSGTIYVTSDDPKLFADFEFENIPESRESGARIKVVTNIYKITEPADGVSGISLCANCNTRFAMKNEYDIDLTIDLEFSERDPVNPIIRPPLISGSYGIQTVERGIHKRIVVLIVTDPESRKSFRTEKTADVEFVNNRY